MRALALFSLVAATAGQRIRADHLQASIADARIELDESKSPYSVRDVP